jgi:hypothetical protein
LQAAEHVSPEVTRCSPRYPHRSFMKTRTSLLSLVLLVVSTPAWATGGWACKIAGERPIEVVLGLGHVPGAP